METDVFLIKDLVGDFSDEISVFRSISSKLLRSEGLEIVCQKKEKSLIVNGTAIKTVKDFYFKLILELIQVVKVGEAIKQAKLDYENGKLSIFALEDEEVEVTIRQNSRSRSFRIPLDQKRAIRFHVKDVPVETFSDGEIVLKIKISVSSKESALIQYLTESSLASPKIKITRPDIRSKSVLFESGIRKKEIPECYLQREDAYRTAGNRLDTKEGIELRLNSIAKRIEKIRSFLAEVEHSKRIPVETFFALRSWVNVGFLSE